MSEFFRRLWALTEVRYKDWQFVVNDIHARPYLQVRFWADGEEWGGRKWYLSEHMTKSEIIQTALKAVITAEEHEARERFLYRGRAIFGPHIDVDDLHEICTSLDVRT